MQLVYPLVLADKAHKRWLAQCSVAGALERPICSRAAVVASFLVRTFAGEWNRIQREVALPQLIRLFV